MKHRIVLDTNCFVSSLSRQGEYYVVWQSILIGTTTLCVTTEILLEYREILEQQLTVSIAENVITVLLNLTNVELISPTYRFDLIKNDPDDNKFVDCAIVSNAKYIVSNDKHFKELLIIDFPKVNVISLVNFVKLLSK
jgi:putative PIN family toxin of toxin-antitoxin system